MNYTITIIRFCRSAVVTSSSCHILLWNKIKIILSFEDTWHTKIGKKGWKFHEVWNHIPLTVIPFRIAILWAPIGTINYFLLESALYLIFFVIYIELKYFKASNTNDTFFQWCVLLFLFILLINYIYIYIYIYIYTDEQV